MSPKGDERRKHKRLKKNLTLRSVSKDYGFISMECRNISAEGAYCLSDIKFPFMTKMLVHLFPSSMDGRSARLASPLSINAYVVRCEKIRSGKNKNRFQLALFFYDMEDSQSHLLKEYIQKSVKRRAASIKATS